MPSLRLAILGAESTGKSWLAQALTEHLRSNWDIDAVWVPEHLRTWCEQRGRTPRQEEQAGIALAQAEAIEQAGARHPVVICDTTPLMTAVYSHQVFGDDSLRAPALEWQASCQWTWLTGLDLPWVADGIQRDGPHVRGPVDQTLRDWLASGRLSWSVVNGTGLQRLQSAIAALEAQLPEPLRPAGQTSRSPGQGRSVDRG